MLDDAQKTPETIYIEDIPDYGYVMAVAEYRDCVAGGGFTDYDGSGCPARDGKMSPHDTIPSKVCELPGDATHIVWFNR